MGKGKNKKRGQKLKNDDPCETSKDDNVLLEQQQNTSKSSTPPLLPLNESKSSSSSLPVLPDTNANENNSENQPILPDTNVKERKALSQPILSVTNDNEETNGRHPFEELMSALTIEGVKDFSTLYNEIVSELVASGKSKELCDKIQNFLQEREDGATSEVDIDEVLKIFQLVTSYYPSILSKFTNSIEDVRNGKDESEAVELVMYAVGCDEDEEAIKTLNKALVLAPTAIQEEPNNISDEDWNERLRQDKLCLVECLESFIGKENSQEHQQQLKVEPENPRAGNHIDCNHKVPNRLLAEIYTARARRFNYLHLHESCILDIFTAVHYGAEKTFEMAHCLASSYKALGLVFQANLLLQHCVELLKASSCTNERKAEKTLQIVKQLKELKSMNRTDDDGKQRQAGKSGEIHEAGSFTGTKDKPSSSQYISQDESTAKIGLKSPSPFCACDCAHSGNQNNDIDSRKLYCGTNSQMTAASDAVELQYNETLGRHIIAKKTILPGETLMLEEPYAWAIHPALFQKRCQHCCKEPREGWVPCQDCSAVIFCSWECRKAAEHYHKFECPILELLTSEELGTMSLLNYRTISKTPLSTLLEYSETALRNVVEVAEGGKDGMTKIVYNRNDCQSQNSSQHSSSKKNSMKTESKIIPFLGLNSAGKFDPSDYASTFAQIANTERRTPGDIVKRVLGAIYLTLCLRYTGYFDYHQSSSLEPKNKTAESNPESDSPMTELDDVELCENKMDDGMKQDSAIGGSQMELSDIELQIASLFFRHSQSTSCNAYAIFVDEHSNSNTLTTVDIGGGTYPTVSCTNHSCNPNVTRYYDGKLCILKSIGEIRPGEQILDSYGFLYHADPKPHRQHHFKTNYFFDCNCEACDHNWPTYSGLNDVQLQEKKKDRKTKPADDKLHKEMKKLESVFLLLKGWYINREMDMIVKNLQPMQSLLCRYIVILQRLGQVPGKRIVECQTILKTLWTHFPARLR